MNYDAPYTMGPRRGLARALQRGGRWDDALAVLPGDQRAARAEVLADRFWWRLGGAAEAAAPVPGRAADRPVLAGFYGAQLAYTRLLFQLDPGPGDLDLARDGFTAAARDRRPNGWGGFWLGVLVAHIDHETQER